MTDETISILSISTRGYKRLLAVSDIHGELDLFKRLLKKVDFCDDDILVLLGDFYLKGSQVLACFDFVMELKKLPNVFVLRGNCDWLRDDFLNDDQWAWLESLPFIIESEDFIFVHAGLEDKPLDEQDLKYCLTQYAFLEVYDGKPFEKWLMVGHWPTDNLQHEVPNHNPIICEEKRIICIDGGNVIRHDGQLNAFMVELDDETTVCIDKFSWDWVDKFPVTTAERGQEGCRGTLNITWNDRFIEILEDGSGGEFSLVRHIESGKVIEMPMEKIWWDDYGRAIGGNFATDHWLAVNEGDEIAVVAEYSDRIFAKKNGEAGWIRF